MPGLAKGLMELVTEVEARHEKLRGAAQQVLAAFGCRGGYVTAGLEHVDCHDVMALLERGTKIWRHSVWAEKDRVYGVELCVFCVLKDVLDAEVES